MSSKAKGQFIPDLLLLQTSAFHPAELERAFRFMRRSLDAGRALEHDFDMDSITVTASFIHELVHYLQFTSRVQGVDYYSCSTELAHASINCLKRLVTLSREEGSPVGIPLDGFARWCFRDGLNCEPVEQWSEKFFVLQTILSMGLLTANPSVDRQRLQVLRRVGNKKLFPTLAFRNAEDGSQTTEKPLTPWMVLETEAFLTTAQFLELYFPGEGLQVLGDLHGEVSDDTLLGVNLRNNGLEKLVPLLADFAMQVSWRSLITGGDFEDYAMTWRFYRALDVCDHFAGITYDETFSRREEILKHLSAKVGGPDIHAEMDKKISELRDGAVEYVERPLQRILLRNMETRRQHRKWFAVPAFWLDAIAAEVCLQRVLFNHYGLDEDHPVLETGMGHSVLSNEERLALYVNCNRRWGGRQIATQEGDLICPECRIMFRRGRCDGKCSFSGMLKREANFDTTTMAFVTKECEA